MSIAFVPIRLDEYVQLHLRNNPRVSAADITARLQFALAAQKAGQRCTCGAPIWVIGSAEAGLSCFTCITGESDPSGDYEIADACDEFILGETPGWFLGGRERCCGLRFAGPIQVNG